MRCDPVWFTSTVLGKPLSSLFIVWWAEKGKGLTFWNAKSQSQAQRESLLYPETPLSLSEWPGQHQTGEGLMHSCGAKPIFSLCHWKSKNLTRSSQNWLMDYVMKTFFSQNNQLHNWVSDNWLRKLLRSILFWETTNSMVASAQLSMQAWSHPFFFFNFLFCIGVYSRLHVVIVSAEQRRDSAIHVHISM